MKAVPHDSCDLELTLAGAGDDRTLPAQRIQAYDPERGEGPEQAHQAVLTRWRPDEGELRALANGALVELIVHANAERQPPVSLNVGNPPDDAPARPLLNAAHVDRAVGAWMASLSDHLLAHDGRFPTAPEALELWHVALERTVDGLPADLQPEALEQRRRELELDMAGPTESTAENLQRIAGDELERAIAEREGDLEEGEGPDHREADREALEAIEAAPGCSCAPRADGQAPTEPDPACPIHGAGA